MNVAKKWTSVSLVWRILGGMVIGAVIGVLAPAGLSVITLLGTLFVSGLKAVAPVLVFFLVISAICNAKGFGPMKTIIVLYAISTIVASLVAVGASFLFPVGITLAEAPADAVSAPEGIGAVLTTLVSNIFVNPVTALTDANYIGILAWAIVLGIALRAAPSVAKTVFGAVADGITKVVQWLIQLAPFGILGLVYTAVSENGMSIFVDYGQLIVLLVGCMLVVAFVTNPIIVAASTHRNPYPLVLRCLKDSAITAFFTRSSAANIPVNMELCRKLGLDEDTYSVSIPLGSTINMCGAAVTIAVMTMATTHLLGISVDFPTALILCLLAAVGACGTSGVAGGSLMLIPMACALFGIGNDIAMQVVGVGFIIGVIQDSCETALNSSSDVLFTATAEYRARMKRGVPFEMGKDAAPVSLDGAATPDEPARVAEAVTAAPALGEEDAASPAPAAGDAPDSEASGDAR